jgi:uncharacterized integral membrane protein
MPSIARRAGHARRARHHYGIDASTAQPRAERDQSTERPQPPATSAIEPAAGTHVPPGPAEANVPHQTHPASANRGRVKIAGTRTGGTWVAVVVAALVLVFLLIFVLQNMTSASVSFLGTAGTLPLGIAMLFAAIAGALFVALIGSARILQLRHRRRRH